jgi:hypothetical protein
VDPAVGVVRALCVVSALGELPSEEGAARHGCLVCERGSGGQVPFSCRGDQSVFVSNRSTY